MNKAVLLEPLYELFILSETLFEKDPMSLSPLVAPQSTFHLPYSLPGR